jgi:hypothetical protein
MDSLSFWVYRFVLWDTECRRSIDTSIDELECDWTELL